MRFVRTIMAFAIAVSLAMVPLGASAAGHAMSSDDLKAGMQMADRSDMSMSDCCPDDMNGMNPHSNGDKCGMGFCCVGGTFMIGNIGPVAFSCIAVATDKVVIPADQVVAFRSASPPFRPPRI